MKAQLFLLFLFFSDCLFAQHLHWSKHDSSNGSSAAKRMDIDEYGNTYATGVFSKEITFDQVKFYAEYQDIFIVKYSAAGVLQWVKQIGNPTYYAYVLDIKVDHKGNIILTGLNSPGDFLGQPLAPGFFLAKFDSDGNLIWVQVDQETSNSEIPEFSENKGGRLQIDQDNNIIRLSDNINTYDSTGALALTKYSSLDGSVLWKKYFTQDTYYHPMLNSIALDSQDNIIISGSFQDSLYIGTIQLKERFPHPYIAKFNNSGDFLWVRIYKDMFIERFTALETDKLDNIYAAGLSTGTFPTGIIMRFTKDGDIDWANNFHNVGFVHPYEITRDNSDNFYISCSIYSAYLYQGHYAIKKAGDMDCFILKIDSAGNFESALTTNGTGYDTAPHQSKVDDQGNIYTVGHFRDTLVVSCDTMIANDISFFVVKHDQASLANINFKINGPDLFCEGAPTLLTTTEVPGSTEYIWNLPNGVTPTSGTNITQANSIWVTATYDSEVRDITMTREASCKDVYGYLFEVRVTPAPTYPGLINSPPLEICHSSKSIAYTVGNDPALTYSWSLPSGVQDTIPTNDGITAYLKFSDTFTSGDITVTGKGGCRDVSSTYHIDAVPFPGDAVDLTGPTEICASPDPSVKFETSHISNISYYEWQIPETFKPSGEFHSSDNFINATIKSQGGRKVSVRGVNKCGQKGNAQTLQVQTWEPVTKPVLKKIPCDLEIIASENENLEWYKDGILIPDFRNDHFPVLDSGVYKVRVSNFCNAEESEAVEAYPLYQSQLNIPNVITPNDDDKNQFFTLEPSLKGSSLSIFNRYGENVFESSDYENNWMGKDLPMGVYYFLINNACLTKPVHGWIQVLH